MPRHTTTSLLLLLSLLATAAAPRPLAAHAPPAEARSYAAIDAVALNVPQQVEEDMEALVRHLTAAARDDREKARAIFRWIAHRIDYDAEAFFRGSVGFASPQEVFRRRRAVCGGYSRLFVHMGRLAGLEVVTVTGRAKAYDPRSATQVSVQDHAWNGVRLDGAWHTLDVTWATGYLSGRSFVRHFDEHWFLTPPEHMVFSHLPSDVKWQRLARPVSGAEFRKLPRVRGSAFALGLSADSIRARSRERGFAGVVESFPLAHPVTARSAPVSHVLAAGTSYTFAFNAPWTAEVVVVDGERWHRLPREGDAFALQVQPEQPGRLIVMARAEGTEEFATFLVYRVEAARASRTKGRRNG
jgi:hypothetical protein